MKKIPGFLLISWILILYTRSVPAQEGAVFRTRQDYYTTEHSGEVMFRFPASLRGQKVKLILGLDSRTVVKLDTMVLPRVIMNWWHGLRRDRDPLN